MQPSAQPPVPGEQRSGRSDTVLTTGMSSKDVGKGGLKYKTVQIDNYPKDDSQLREQFSELKDVFKQNNNILFRDSIMTS